jgi:hypothetical protein
MILGDVRAGPAIASRAESFKLPSTNHPCECARVNALSSGITGSEERTPVYKAQHVCAGGSWMSRHVEYDYN